MASQKVRYARVVQKANRNGYTLDKHEHKTSVYYLRKEGFEKVFYRLEDIIRYIYLEWKEKNK